MTNGKGNFVDPDEFKQDKRELGEGEKDGNYPRDWKEPHHHGDDKYNPHMDVMCYPDGTRHYYDPVTHTESYEHSSGYHRIVAADFKGEYIPGEHREFVGSGQTRTVGGHVNEHIAGGLRTEIQGGHMHVVGGDQSVAVQGNQAVLNMGHSRTHVMGHHETRLLGDNSSYGVGVGASEEHESRMTMTKDKMHVRSQGDVVVQSDGKTVTIQSAGDMKIICGGKLTIEAEDMIFVTSKGKDVRVANPQGNTIIGLENVENIQNIDKVATMSGPAKLAWALK